jgi:hypothetical protein
MDGTRILILQEWDEKVLKPLAEESPEKNCLLCILDSYHCHKMMLVYNAINELVGVDQVHIPGGCITLCQPVEVGIN